MSTPTAGIVASIYQPLIRGGAFVERVQHPAGYSHTIQALGGYWSASFKLSGGLVDLGDWLSNGLLRHVDVHGSGLEVCWSGFVNKLTFAYGPLTVALGPVLDVCNRADLYYSAVDDTTTPPTVGMRAAVGVASDILSQARWGIRDRILSTGGLPLVGGVCVQGQNIRDMYLAETAYPPVNKTWRTGAGQPPSVTAECLGYCHWLDYPYNDATTGAITTYAKILLLLAANPNIAWLPFDTTGVNLPAAPANVDRWEADNNPAWDLIMDCVVRGDTNQARWLFGVYGGLRANYNIAPSAVEYQQMLGDPAQRVMRNDLTVVEPWRIQPGRWILFPDLNIGSTSPTSLYEDPRAMFIESVTYTAPSGLQLTGGRQSKLSQLLAQLGLAGIGG